MRDNNHFSHSSRSFDNGTRNKDDKNNGKRTEYFNNGAAPEDSGKNGKQKGYFDKGTLSKDNEKTGTSEMRLQVYLAHAGVASRRACEKIIAEGRVSVNGALVTDMGSKVRTGDTVLLDGKPVHPEARKCYVLLNKPAGFVCTLSDEKGRPTAADLLKETYSERLYNIGRLDMFSSGAILFTNDGDFAAKIEHPSAQIEKEYVIETTQDFPPELLTRFERGIRVDGIFYKCRSAAAINRRKLRIILVEGKNREIRRVLDSFNCTIKRLVRVRIGNLELGTLKAGEFRDLTAKERQALLELATESQNEERKYTE